MLRPPFGSLAAAVLAGLLAVLLAGAPAVAAEPTRLTVMTFNTWGLGQLAGQPLEKVAEAIRAAKADIVGIQETRLESVPEGQESDPPPEFGYGESKAAELARLLGWSYVDQVPQVKTFKAAGLWSNAVLSRYPIAGVTPTIWKNSTLTLA